MQTCDTAKPERRKGGRAKYQTDKFKQDERQRIAQNSTSVRWLTADGVSYYTNGAISLDVLAKLRKLGVLTPARTGHQKVLYSREEIDQYLELKRQEEKGKFKEANKGALVLSLSAAEPPKPIIDDSTQMIINALNGHVNDPHRVIQAILSLKLDDPVSVPRVVQALTQIKVQEQLAAQPSDAPAE